MTIAQWNSFTNYVAGNQVQNGTSTVYGCVLENVNEPPPNATYWNALTPPAGSGLTSLNALTSGNNSGNLSLISTTGDISYGIDTGNGTIDLAITTPIPTQYVASLAVNLVGTLTGNVDLANGNGVIVSYTAPSISFEIDPTKVVTELVAPGVTLAGSVTVAEGTGILITGDTLSNTLEFAIDPADVVTSITGGGLALSGGITLEGGDGVTITQTPAQTFTIGYTNPTLTQYGVKSPVLPGFPNTEIVTLPVAYDNSDYFVSVQLAIVESTPFWMAVTNKTVSSFVVNFGSSTATGRAIIYEWMTVGDTPAP